MLLQLLEQLTVFITDTVRKSILATDTVRKSILNCNEQGWFVVITSS